VLSQLVRQAHPQVCDDRCPWHHVARGSFRGWEHIASTDKFLYTHRSGKWATFYSPDARNAQRRFFDRYLRGRDVAAPPRVRLEVRETRDEITSVRAQE
jgi:hypothetical protein